MQAMQTVKRRDRRNIADDIEETAAELVGLLRRCGQTFDEVRSTDKARALLFELLQEERNT